MAQKECANEPCTCQADEGSAYCSNECQAAASRSTQSCTCGHEDCAAQAKAREKRASA
jgi:hypothetical protein